MEDKIKSGRYTGMLSVRFRPALFPMVIGFLVILYAGLLFLYLQQQREQESLREEITAKEMQLQRPSVITDSLKAYSVVAQNSIPTEIKGEDLIGRVILVAAKSGFDITPQNTNLSVIQKDSVKKEKVIKSDYQALSFAIGGLEGDYQRIAAFISNLYSEPGLETLVVDKVVMSRDPNSNDVKVSIDFTVYGSLAAAAK